QGVGTACRARADRARFVRPPGDPRREGEGDVGPRTSAHRARGGAPNRRARARGPRTRARIETTPSRSPSDRDVRAGNAPHPARAGPERPRNPDRTDRASVRVGGDGETPRAGVPSDEPEV